MKPWVFVVGCFLGYALTGSGQQTTNRVIWDFQTGRYVFSSPAIADDGTIYIGSADGRLYALRPDGSMKWSFVTGAEIQSSPAIGRDGTIYFGSADKKVYALNPDGSKKWEFVTGNTILCSPTLGADETIYIGSRDGNYYAIEPDGRQSWKFPTGQYYTDMPAVIGSEGTILVSAAGCIHALKRNGEERWQKALGTSMSGVSMAIGRGGRIYASIAELGPGRTLLFALSHRGEMIWEFACGNITAVANPCFPAIARDGTVYLATPDSFLYAIREDGTLRWKVPATRNQSAPALSSDGKIYLNSSPDFSSPDFRLLAYNTDGVREWEQKLGTRGAAGLVSSFPTLKDGVIYIGSGDSKVYAIRASGELDAGSWPAFGRDLQHSGRDLQRGIEAAAEPTTGAQELRLTVEPGRTYILQGSSDLQTWQDCTAIVSASSVVTVPRVGNHSYYRLAAP